MRTLRAHSRSRAVYWLFAALIACTLGSVVTCTISDENGQPAIAGPYNPPSDIDPVVPVNVNPALVVGPVDNIRPGDTISITVTVIDLNIRDTTRNAIRGIRVAAEATPAGGRFVADTLTTNLYGRVVFRYTDMTEGQKSITFTVVGISPAVSSSPVRLIVSPSPVPQQRLMTIQADASALKADGRSSTGITVTVISPDHNPLVGEQVRFISTAGVIAGTNPPSPAQSGIAITDEDGIARAKLTSTNLNDTAFITAYLVSNLNLTAETKVAFTGVHIDISIDTTNLRTNQTVLLAATLLNGANEPIAQMPIYMYASRGAASNITIASADTLTGFSGIATALLTGTTNGSDSIIIASAGAREVLLVNVTDLKLTASLNQTQLVASDTARTTLNVLFTTTSDAPLANRLVRVRRSYPDANGAAAADTISAQTGSDGRAAITIPGLAWDGLMRLAITAYETVNSIATAEASLVFSTTRNLTIEALPTIIAADGSSGSEITVTIKTDQNNPIIGDTVLFSSTAGLIPARAITDSLGKANVVLRSDRRNVTAKVKATLKRDPARKDSVNVVFAGVSIVANAAPRSIRGNGSDTSFISTILTDAMGNPIPGEPINFTPQQSQTRVVSVSAVTDNRGEAFCKIVGNGAGSDTVTIYAAGATARPVLFYSTNILTVDTSSATTTIQPLVANGKDSTQFRVTYTTGAGAAISGANVAVSVTLGNIGAVFAQNLTTDGSGNAYFYMKNPTFANTATVAVEAFSTTEVTTVTRKIYFNAAAVFKIKLTATPSVISTNGSKATITAVAYDSLMNRVADALIAFNLIRGPGGGEFLDPPTAVTSTDGVATTSLVAGSVPSMSQEVRIVAGDFEAVKSDTVKMTIAGPPYRITVRSNVLKGLNPNDGTFGLPCAALVVDVNSNPVADGTPVTFSAHVTGLVTYRLKAWWYPLLNYYAGGFYQIDTVRVIVPFEDLNDNCRLDPGEDKDFDGYANRGEDRNGDCIYNPGPGFEDINGNGLRDRNPEPWRAFQRKEDSAYDSSGVTLYKTILVWDTAFADLNGNNILDTVEPLLDERYKNLTWAEYEAWRDTAQGGFGFDYMFDRNGVADPATAIKIKRTVQTFDGKAINELWYGQSDAGRIQATISAEAQGVVTIVPDIVILPVIE